MSEMSSEMAGKLVEGYKVIKPLGQGKFSIVYQAQRQIDNKLVALKIVKVWAISLNLDIRHDGSETEREMSTGSQATPGIYLF